VAPLIEAIASFPWLGRAGDQPPDRLRVVIDEASGAAVGLRGIRRDAPRSFQHRRFGHRYVREFTVPAVPCPTEAS
jgi:hypothetical protein